MGSAHLHGMVGVLIVRWEFFTAFRGTKLQVTRCESLFLNGSLGIVAIVPTSLLHSNSPGGVP